MNRRTFFLASSVGLPLAAQGVADRLQIEIRRSQPDYIVYAPGHWDGSRHDGLNEHFLVFDGPDGSMMAIWTQSDKGAGTPGVRQKNRIRFSRSTDEGRTWSAPAHVVGPRTQDDSESMASWAFPLVS